MSFIVYIHTCPNGKKYVGVTKRTTEERWRNGEGYKHNLHFTSAIKKYGWDNIEHEFFEVKSSSLMLFWERILIYHHKTTDNMYGYNKSGGGEGINGYYRSEEINKKISKTLTGRKRPPFSDEHKRKIADALTGRKRPSLSNEIKTKISLGGKGLKRSEQTKINIGNAIRGLKRSEESRKRISEAKKLYWENKRKNTI